MSLTQATNSLDDTTLAILAGGEGSRMGQAKGLLTLGNRPILDYLVDNLAWPGPTMLVTAPNREHPPAWTRFTREVTDPIAGAGPLRGILTALENLDTPLLLVLTIDMPGVRIPHTTLILDVLRKDPKSLGAMMRRIAAEKPHIEPFPLALKINAKPIIAQRLGVKKRSVHGLLDEPGFRAVDVPRDWPPSVWTNLNSVDDLVNFDPSS